MDFADDYNKHIHQIDLIDDLLNFRGLTICNVIHTIGSNIRKASFMSFTNGLTFSVDVDNPRSALHGPIMINYTGTEKPLYTANLDNETRKKVEAKYCELIESLEDKYNKSWEELLNL
jgi:hypothetical protein